MQATRDFSHYVRDCGFGTVRISILRSRASVAPAACPRSSAGFPRIPDVTLARVNLTDRRVALEWKQGALDPARFIDRLAELGYKAYPFETGSRRSDGD